MYGKAYSSMYEGSLYGKGVFVFAVWNYVIANQVPDRALGSVVTLNPKKLADTLGEEREPVEKAIRFLCQPDPESTTKTANGKRLIQVAEFEYQVVNGAKYRAIRDEEERREQNREAKRRERLNRYKQNPLPRESTTESVVEQSETAADAERAMELGTGTAADQPQPQLNQ